MRIWLQAHPGFYVTAHPIDDQGRLWMQEEFPADKNQYYGGSLVIEWLSVERFENKFLADGGQLL